MTNMPIAPFDYVCHPSERVRFETNFGVRMHDLQLSYAVAMLHKRYAPKLAGAGGRIITEREGLILMGWSARPLAWMPLWHGTDECFALLAKYANWGDVMFFKLQAEGAFSDDVVP